MATRTKAKDVFASDLLAARDGVLEHDYEIKAKQLLNLSFELELKGDHVDALFEAEIDDLKRELLSEALVA